MTKKYEVEVPEDSNGFVYISELEGDDGEMPFPGKMVIYGAGADREETENFAQKIVNFLNKEAESQKENKHEH